MTIDETKEIIQGKLDCMNKCGIFNKDNNDNDNDCDNCEYCYSQGTFGEQKEAYQIAINSLEELKAIKEMDLDIQDHINVTYSGSDKIVECFTKYADFIVPSFPGCPFGSMIIGIQFLFFKHSISLFILL